MKLKLDGGGSEVTWVDAANYGIAEPAQGTPSASSANALADWYCAAASTLHSLGPCGWQATAASQSMHLFRAVYHETPILCDTHPLATRLCRDGLFGGRCEPFRLGKCAGPVYLYDFRSMYPYLYSTERVPTRLLYVRESCSVADLLAIHPDQWCIAKVDIETDEPEYPCHAGNAVVYPVGRFTTVLGGSELTHALSSGRVRRVRLAAIYQADSVLAGYAEALYRCRCESDSRRQTQVSQWIKRVLNCLHGKFAQQERQWVDCPGATCPWEWGEWYHQLESGEFERRRVLAGAIQREEKGGFAHGTVPAITAAICAAGRNRLLDVIRCAGWDHTLYADTDAIIVDSVGRQRLADGGWIRPGEWGYLQLQEHGAEATIFGVRHYAIGERYRESGYPASGREGAAQGLEITRMPGVRERIIRKQAPADWRETHPFTRGPGRYDQRREAGGWVRPMELDVWED